MHVFSFLSLWLKIAREKAKENGLVFPDYKDVLAKVHTLDEVSSDTIEKARPSFNFFF